MKYLTLICLFILSACNLNDNIVELNDNTLKKRNVKNFNLSDAEFKRMSFNEFELFLKDLTVEIFFMDTVYELPPGVVIADTISGKSTRCGFLLYFYRKTNFNHKNRNRKFKKYNGLSSDIFHSFMENGKFNQMKNWKKRKRSKKKKHLSECIEEYIIAKKKVRITRNANVKYIFKLIKNLILICEGFQVFILIFI